MTPNNTLTEAMFLREHAWFKSEQASRIRYEKALKKIAALWPHVGDTKWRDIALEALGRKP